jgi:hypothetical protein
MQRTEDQESIRSAGATTPKTILNNNEIWKDIPPDVIGSKCG